MWYALFLKFQKDYFVKNSNYKIHTISVHSLLVCLLGKYERKLKETEWNTDKPETDSKLKNITQWDSFHVKLTNVELMVAWLLPFFFTNLVTYGAVSICRTQQLWLLLHRCVRLHCVHGEQKMVKGLQQFINVLFCNHFKYRNNSNTMHNKILHWILWNEITEVTGRLQKKYIDKYGYWTRSKYTQSMRIPTELLWTCFKNANLLNYS